MAEICSLGTDFSNVLVKNVIDKLNLTKMNRSHTLKKNKE